jgi:hypothetical protein
MAVSPMLKYPLVAETLTENETVATATNAAKTAIRLTSEALPVNANLSNTFSLRLKSSL